MRDGYNGVMAGIVIIVVPYIPLRLCAAIGDIHYRKCLLLLEVGELTIGFVVDRILRPMMRVQLFG